jgi:3-hydroxyisobutyrate dehydrogenase-like beta-hydroxyacid dehydrogenase
MNKSVVVAVIAPGGMGAPVGRRLAERGARVITDLEGRSAQSIARARDAGMTGASLDAVAAADLILSIVPPGEALCLAERLAPALAAAPAKATYVDCNAVSPQTVTAVAEVVTRTGAAFVDAGIIGGPPQTSGYCPAFYACGPEVQRFAVLKDYGLDVRPIEGPVGQASALKMCYAATTKGLHAIGVSVLLAAMKAGVADHLMAELADSQPEFLDYFTQRTPRIFDKTYRWVAEMEEIGAFLGDPGGRIYDGAARMFEELASDHEGDRVEQEALLELLRRARG